MIKKGYFILDGVNSEDLNLFIQRTPLLETPSRRVELRNAFGVHGGVPYDERAYDNTEMQLLMFIDGTDKNKDREKVDAILRNTGVFKELIPYWDPTKIYYIMTLCLRITITNRINSWIVSTIYRLIVLSKCSFIVVVSNST